ncbi:Uncharacterized protein APZ42_024172 [Daphnia magna]|uniref:Uncharacterized protein n=1 Tax=Daphnia magna TaxID=35525 RepID=A0A164UHU0_9CRUS|nr:Uncharacterized protein APZ42_024172 [Daphnia magna]
MRFNRSSSSLSKWKVFDIVITNKCIFFITECRHSPCLLLIGDVSGLRSRTIRMSEKMRKVLTNT